MERWSKSFLLIFLINLLTDSAAVSVNVKNKTLVRGEASLRLVRVKELKQLIECFENLWKVKIDASIPAIYVNVSSTLISNSDF